MSRQAILENSVTQPDPGFDEGGPNVKWTALAHWGTLWRMDVGWRK